MKAKTVLLIIGSFLLPIAARAQTFEVNGQQPQSQTAPAKPGAKQKKGQAPAQNNAGGDSGIGWGSSCPR